MDEHTQAIIDLRVKIRLNGILYENKMITKAEHDRVNMSLANSLTEVENYGIINTTKQKERGHGCAQTEKRA